MPEHQSRCLVLGGGGFLGSNLVEKLLSDGYKVRVFDLVAASRINLKSDTSQLELCQGDFLDQEDVEHALEDVDFVFHLVGTTLPADSNDRPIFDIESNVIGTIRLLQACVRRGVKRVLFASSGGTVYGAAQKIPIPEEHPTEPLCSYGIAKLTIEKYLSVFYRAHGLDYTVLRIANPYGRYQIPIAAQGAIGVFMTCLRDRKPIRIWGDGSVTRDYIYVEDVATAFAKALTNKSQYRIFNIGTGEGISLRDLLVKIRQITGIEPHVQYSAGRLVDVPTNILDSNRARRYMGWQAETTRETGLRKMWDWVCSGSAQIATVSGASQARPSPQS